MATERYMSEGGAGAGGRGADANAEDWVTRVAESEGIDREEAVQRLVSSYWTLQEIHGMMEGGGEEGAEPPADHRSVREVVEDVEARLSELDRELAEHEHEARSGDLAEEVGEVRSRVGEVEERLWGGPDALEPRFDEELVHLETILSHLLDTTDDLEARLEALTTRVDDVAEEPDEPPADGWARRAWRTLVRIVTLGAR